LRSDSGSARAALLLLSAQHGRLCQRPYAFNHLAHGGVFATALAGKQCSIHAAARQ
jgi:hypothetical protein